MSMLRSFIFILVLATAAPVHAETITLGAEDAWYPYSGVVNGEARGSTVDLVRAAFAAVNVEVKFRPLPYARCTNEVKEGRLLGCFNTARSNIVEPHYLWHKQPMFSARILIYARSDHTRRNLGVPELEGKQVIVSHTYEYGDAFDSNQKIIRQTAPADLNGFRMLLAKRGEYVLAYEKVANLLIKDNPAEFGGKIIPVGVIDELKLYISFSKTFPKSSRYVELFDQGFAIISKNGRLREIEKQWN